MPSDKQIEASRLNGVKSRGPVTDLRPESPIEDLLVQKMAVTDPETRDALSFRAAGNQMSEYEARCDRQFERSLERFEKFRVARRAAESGGSNPGTL